MTCLVYISEVGRVSSYFNSYSAAIEMDSVTENLDLVQLEDTPGNYERTRAPPKVARASAKKISIYKVELFSISIYKVELFSISQNLVAGIDRMLSVRYHDDRHANTNVHIFTDHEMGEEDEQLLLEDGEDRDRTDLYRPPTPTPQIPAPTPQPSETTAPATGENTTRKGPKQKGPKTAERRVKDRQRQRAKRHRKFLESRDMSNVSSHSADGGPSTSAASVPGATNLAPTTLQTGNEGSKSVLMRCPDPAALRSGPDKQPRNKHRAKNPNKQQKTPAEVFVRGKPEFSLVITTAGTDAAKIEEQVKMLLFTADGDYTVSCLRGVGPGRVALDCHNEESVKVVKECLTGGGLEVSSVSAIGQRYFFVVPTAFTALSAPVIVESLQKRNRKHGFPQGSLSLVSKASEGEGGRKDGPSRVRIWVDANIEAETWLKAHDFLMETSTAAVRLKPAPRFRHRSERS